MRLPSFRVRTLMLAVGVVVLLIWAAITGTRWFVYSSRAAEYAQHEHGWRQIAAEDLADDPAMAEFHSRCVEYYTRLAAKYRRAMWQPWMPTTPDPYPPGWEAYLKQQAALKQSP